MPPRRKPKVGVFGLTGCAGDQLVLLNCEDELLELAGLMDLRDFAMGSSDVDLETGLDIAFVEGAVLSGHDRERLLRIRRRSRLVVALGTCAVWGGVAAMDRWWSRAQLLREVYGEQGIHYDSQPAQALREVVAVDLNVPGCPIEKYQLISAVSHLLNGNPPIFPEHSVCAECKIRENHCLLERGKFCCGPLTVAGCDARCPGLGVPCIGCRGPAADANPHSFRQLLQEKGIDLNLIEKKIGTFAPSPLESPDVGRTA